MVSSLVSAVGFENMSVYTKSISEFGKMTMIGGVVGLVASPILGNSWQLGAGAIVLGYAAWGLFADISKDFHAVDIVVKKSLAARQEWRSQHDLNAERFTEI